MSEAKTVGEELDRLGAVVIFQNRVFGSEPTNEEREALDALCDDAHIIRGTCATCGGSGKRKDKWAGAVREVACPDCADTPVWVIAPEAWEAFARALVAAASGLDETGEEWNEAMEGMWEESYDEAVARFKERAPAVLQSILPGARRAKEVYVVTDDWEFDAGVEVGDTYAVLEDE